MPHRRKGSLWFVLSCLLSAGCRARTALPAPDAIDVSVPYELETLDPHATDRLSNFGIAVNFYEPLVAMDADMGIHPRLAVRWENPDLLTWVFYLQKGVRFHDGKPFSAEDVVHSYERILRDPALDIGVYAVGIAGVRALAPDVVEVKTRRPMSVLLNKLASVLIVPKGADSAFLARHVNGTAPYKLVEWATDTVRMERSDAYWGPHPPIRRASFHLNRNAEQALADLAAGTSQLVQAPSRKLEEAVRARGDLTLVRRPSLFLKFLGFNLEERGARSNPFLDRRVRLAVQAAIDRRELTRRLSTFAVPATEIVPSFIFGFDPAIPPAPSGVDVAKALLREAGRGSGFDVTLHARKGSEEPARLVAGMLRPAGIRVTVEAVPDPQFYELARRHEPLFYLSRFACSSGDASDVLEGGLHTADPARHLGGLNYAGYSNAELDAAIERSGEILELTSRRGTLQSLIRRVTDDAVWVPLYVDEDAYALKKPFTFRPRADSYVVVGEIAAGAEGASAR